MSGHLSSGRLDAPGSVAISISGEENNMSGPSVITVNGLRKAFEKAEVLKGVTLEIPAGSVVGLLGKNGSGKSTLIKCLLGLLRPTDGTVRVFGEDPWELSAESKSRLGYAAQEVSHYPWMRIRQVMEYTAAFYPNWDEVTARSLAEQWELPLNERVGPMSPGQQQKLSLVLAMGHRPDLLILDEPVASLDPSARREFLGTILDVASSRDRTVLFSTHITTDLERVADRVAILQDGLISYFDEMDALKESVKRLRIRSAKPLPSSFSVAGALRCRVSGQDALVAVAKLDESLIEELCSVWHAEVSVEDLSLEDIFLEMHHDA